MRVATAQESQKSAMLGADVLALLLAAGAPLPTCNPTYASTSNHHYITAMTCHNFGIDAGFSYYYHYLHLTLCWLKIHENDYHSLYNIRTF